MVRRVYITRNIQLSCRRKSADPGVVGSLVNPEGVLSDRVVEDLKMTSVRRRDGPARLIVQRKRNTSVGIGVDPCANDSEAPGKSISFEVAGPVGRATRG